MLHMISASGPCWRCLRQGPLQIELLVEAVISNQAFWKEAGEPNDVNQKLTTISQVAQHELISKNIFFKLLGMKH